MRSSDFKREDNYNEYLRLSQNDDYIDVTFDQESGGVSAVHRLHKFDKQKGIYGICRGDYERKAIKTLRENGYRVLLESELSSQDTKVCDGYLDDIPMEIKSVEGNGTWSISTKLHNAEKQHAKCVVLYYPYDNLYSSFKVSEGIRLFNSNPSCKKGTSLDRIIIIVRDKIISEIKKPPRSRGGQFGKV